jgi:hypothetical protein
MLIPRKTVSRLILASVIATLAGAAWAQESSPGLTPGFGLRLFGLDLDFTTDIPNLLPVGKTELLSSFGGGLVSRGFYRDASGARADGPGGAISSVDADYWLKATQYLDRASRLRASLFLRGQALSNLRDAGGAPSLLAASGLPESSGAAELGAGAAFGYTDLDRKTASGQEIGIRADLSYEFSYELYPASMSTGMVNEFAAEFSGFLPLVDSQALSLVLGEHLLASALVGTGIPEFRRSQLGGNRYLPYKALGGIVRGLPDNSRDGLLKAANNLELRLTLPSVLKGALIPGFIAFVDTGISDDGAYGADLGTFGLTGGGVVTVKVIGFTLYAGGVVDMLTLEPGLEWGFGLKF